MRVGSAGCLGGRRPSCRGQDLALGHALVDRRDLATAGLDEQERDQLIAALRWCAEQPEGAGQGSLPPYTAACSPSPPSASRRQRSQPSISGSISPSRTACTFPSSTPLRRSLTSV